MSTTPYFSAIRRLAEYEAWCNAQLLDAAAGLPRADLFQAFPFGLQTIHQTLFHTVEVLGAWTNQIGPEQTEPCFVAYDPDVPLSLIADWNAESAQRFLKAIDSSHAAGLLPRDRRVEQVFHLVTHGTHHRTQCISMLRGLGVDPPYEPGDFGGWSNTP